jgi:hypothetical protein
MAHPNRIFVVVLGLTLATACDRPNDVGPIGSPAPTAVTCADAAQLRKRAADERRQTVETTSDQEKIIAGSRAAFYMSLAITADLKCKVTSTEADATLTRALAAAAKAEGTRSFYESAVLWAEAGMAASEAVSILMEQ